MRLKIKIIVFSSKHKEFSVDIRDLNFIVNTCFDFLIFTIFTKDCNTYLSTFFSSSSFNWTLYNLELPTALILYNDFLSLANIHQFSSPQTYCHLISEAHMILRITLMLLQWRNRNESAVNLITPSKNDNEELLEAYKESCRLLGDYFVM